MRTFCVEGNLDAVYPPGQYIPPSPIYTLSGQIMGNLLENLGWATLGGILWWAGNQVASRASWTKPTVASLAAAIRPLLPRMIWTEGQAIRRAAAVFPALVAINLGLLAWTNGTRINSSNDADVFRHMTLYHAALMALAAGFGEEILYRAIMQGGLARLFGAHRPLAPHQATATQVFPRISMWIGRPMTWDRIAALAFAVLIQSVVFAYAHAGYADHQALLFAFLFALGMGIVVLRVGLWPAVVLHVLIDFAKFASDAAPGKPVFVGVAILVACGIVWACVAEARDFLRTRGRAA